MREYKVIQDYSLEHLQISVSNSLTQGWSLVGGVAITHTWFNENDEISDKGKPRILYAQAVTK